MSLNSNGFKQEKSQLINELETLDNVLMFLEQISKEILSSSLDILIKKHFSDLKVEIYKFRDIVSTKLDQISKKLIRQRKKELN